MSTSSGAIVEQARSFIAIVGNCGLYPDKAQRTIEALCDELERLQGERDGLDAAATVFGEVAACDKCDLCEDHHA
jgi:hypothetical protein